MEEINRDNCRLLLAAFMENESLSVREVAKAITCTEMTLKRILSRKTLPSNEMLKQAGIMIELGWQRYSKLSKAEKENISETIGAVGGGVLGFGTITAAISVLGIPGLSAVGITSGLAALGTIVGGGMVAGVSVAAAIPIAAACLGYVVIKAVKFFVGEHELDAEKYDPFWERPLENNA